MSWRQAQKNAHLEPNIYGGAVDGRRPPEGEAPVGNLHQTTTLRISKLLVLHLLFEPARLLPKQPLPGGKVRPLEQSVLQDTLHASQRLHYVISGFAALENAAASLYYAPFSTSTNGLRHGPSYANPLSTAGSDRGKCFNLAVWVRLVPAKTAGRAIASRGTETVMNSNSQKRDFKFEISNSNFGRR